MTKKFDFSHFPYADFIKKKLCHAMYKDPTEIEMRSDDFDVCLAARTIEGYYHGYSYVFVFEDDNHVIYNILDNERTGFQTVNRWCKENCEGKYRFDFQRVSRNDSDGKWILDEISGGDYMFAAFQEEKDFLWFLLKWNN